MECAPRPLSDFADYVLSASMTLGKLAVTEKGRDLSDLDGFAVRPIVFQHGRVNRRCDAALVVHARCGHYPLGRPRMSSRREDASGNEHCARDADHYPFISGHLPHLLCPTYILPLAVIC
jgi:hypothetical protein